MTLLLDTQAFLWWVTDDARLSARARTAIASRTAECLLSVASCWEMAIKASLGKLTLAAPLERFLSEQLGVNEIALHPIAFAHAVHVARLPFHHRDPFDRLIAAQALCDGLTIVSSDPMFRRYGVKRIW